MLGEGPAAEAVAEAVFVRAWRAGVDRWGGQDADGSDGDGGDSGVDRARSTDRALRWLLRLTHALAVARVADDARSGREPARTPVTSADTGAVAEDGGGSALPGFGAYGEALAAERREVLARVLWRGETIATVAREAGRTRRAVAEDVRAALKRARVCRHALLVSRVVGGGGSAGKAIGEANEGLHSNG